MTNRPMTNRPMTNRPMTNRPMTNRPMTNHPITNRPMTNRPMTNRPMTNHPYTELIEGISSMLPLEFQLLSDTVKSHGYDNYIAKGNKYVKEVETNVLK